MLSPLSWLAKLVASGAGVETVMRGTKQGVVALRRKARETVSAQLAAIDEIARRLLGL